MYQTLQVPLYSTGHLKGWIQSKQWLNFPIHDFEPYNSLLEIIVSFLKKKKKKKFKSAGEQSLITNILQIPNAT